MHRHSTSGARQPESSTRHSSLVTCHSAFFIVFVALLAANADAAPKVVYVAPGGTGDGSSWANAMGNVSNAYASAAAYADGGFDRGEVWIRTGRYTIDNEITVRSNVSVLGGFLGTETDASQARRENLTILSGDKRDDDTWSPGGARVWTGDGNMTFTPPNPSGIDGYWSNTRGPSGYDYAYGFRSLESVGAVSNCVFSGLTFTAFETRPLDISAGGPHRRIVLTNCNFWACAVNSSCAANIFASDFVISDNVCWGGRSGFALKSSTTTPSTNEISRCIFRNIRAGSTLFCTSGTTDNLWLVTDCDFFRNRNADTGQSPTVTMANKTRAVLRMTRCTIRECFLTNTARGLVSGGDGGAYQNNFLVDCDICDNVSSNCTYGNGCFSGTFVGISWVFLNCSIRNNTMWHSGAGNVASVYRSTAANQFAVFQNCSILDNRVVNAGEGTANSCGTLSLTVNNSRLSVVNCLLDGNECSGAITNADIVSSITGNSMALAVVNSVVSGKGAGYAAVKTRHPPYLYKSCLAGFDRNDAGCASFSRCEGISTDVDPHVCAKLRSKEGAPHQIKGLWVDSPFWRGGTEIYWRDRGASLPHVLLRDPTFHTYGGKCWHPIDFQYGEDNFTDATAATYGLTVDSPLVPDALGNPRKAGRVAYGPIGYAHPAVMKVR